MVFVVGYSVQVPERVISPSNALALVRLLFTSKDWINRRIDAVEFPDALSIQRRVSLDITVPSEVPTVRPERGPERSIPVLPVALFRKELIVRFEFTQDDDPSRGKVPKLTRTHGRDIMTEMLVEWALFLNSSADRESLRDNVRDLLNLDNNLSTKERERLLTQGEAETVWGISGDSSQQSFLALARMLGRNFLIFFPLTEDAAADAGRRILATYAYRRPLHLFTRSVAATHVKRFFGFCYKDLVIPATDSGYCHSYHFEMTVPRDVSVRVAELYDDGRVHREREHLGGENCFRNLLPNWTRDYLASRELRQMDITRLAPRPGEQIHKTTDFGLNPLKNIGYETRGVVAVRLVALRPLWLTALCWLTWASALFTTLMVSYRPISSDKTQIALIAATLGIVVSAVVSPEGNDFSKPVLTSSRITGFLTALTLVVTGAIFQIDCNPTFPGIFSITVLVLLAIRQTAACWLWSDTPPKILKSTTETSNIEKRRKEDSKKFFLKSGMYRERQELQSWQYEYEYVQGAANKAKEIFTS